MGFGRIVIASSFLSRNDPFGKPLHTLPDHALRPLFKEEIAK
jgi:hypothetical protein